MEDTAGIMVDAVLSGPDGRHRMQLRVVHNDAPVFESHRYIQFRDGEARLCIMPLVDVPKDSRGELHLTIDGELLPPIIF